MLKKFLILAIVFIFSISAFSQHSVNDYKYVIVPNQFDFLDEDDQFQLNSITHFLFNKYGFTAIKEDDIFPQDLMFNPCLALKCEVVDDSGAFKTKLAIQLKNCKDDIIYISEKGESFDKKYAVAYNKALREAFMYVAALNYVYKPNEYILSLSRDKKVDDTKEIEQLKEEIAALKEEKETQVVSATSIDTINNKVQEQVTDKTETKETILFAQKTEGGYQLVNESSKVVMILLNTRNLEVFMVQGKNATVFKEEDSWYLSENNGSDVKDTKLNIKF